MDITKLSLVELKAAIYDQMVIIEQAQQNIRTINERVSVLMTEPKNTKEKL